MIFGDHQVNDSFSSYCNLYVSAVKDCEEITDDLRGKTPKDRRNIHGIVASSNKAKSTMNHDYKMKNDRMITSSSIQFSLSLPFYPFFLRTPCLCIEGVFIHVVLRVLRWPLGFGVVVPKSQAVS